MLFIKNLKQFKSKKKLANKYIESFEIFDIIETQTYKLQLFSKWKIYFVFHVFLLKKYRENFIIAISTKVQLYDDEKQWEIKKILNVKDKTKKSRYLVRWKKFVFCENQWLSKNELDNAKNVLTSFKRKRVNITIIKKNSNIKKLSKKNRNWFKKMSSKNIVDNEQNSR